MERKIGRGKYRENRGKIASDRKHKLKLPLLVKGSKASVLQNFRMEFSE